MKTRIYFRLTLLILLFAAGLPGRTMAQDKNLLQLVCDSRPLLKEALMQSGMSSTLADNGTYTFFAPSEQAVQKMANGNPAKLREMLMNHLVAGKLVTDDLKDGTKLTTAGGAQISIFRKHNDIWINGARITEANRIATNGVLHVVDNWLITPIASN